METVALTLVSLVGIGLIHFGLLQVFAAGMSSNPSASAAAEKSGCITLLIGIAVAGFVVYKIIAG